MLCNVSTLWTNISHQSISQSDVHSGLSTLLLGPDGYKQQIWWLPTKTVSNDSNQWKLPTWQRRKTVDDVV